MLRPGGRAVYLAWTPEGGLGGWFRITNKHVPPPPGVPPAFNWGDAEKSRALLGPAFRDVTFTRGDCPQFGATPEEIWTLFSTRYGPTVRAVSTLSGEKLDAFRSEMLSFLEGYRTKADGKVRWGREYLITRATRV